MAATRLTTKALAEKLPPWGVLVMESHHAPNFTMEWRTHRFVKVLYATSGTGTVLIGKRKVGFLPRDVVVVPPDKRNRIVDDPGSPTSLYILCVARKLLAFDRHVVGQLSTGRLARSPRFANQAERRLRRLLFEQKRDRAMTPLVMVAEVLALLQLVIEQSGVDLSTQRPSSGPRAEMQRYIEHLNNSFFEATTIDAAAAQMGMRRRSFTRFFREQAGESWLEHVRRRGVDHAARLLTETRLPIASIAFECGFEDLSNFYRRFKRQYGVAPGRWREAHRR